MRLNQSVHARRLHVQDLIFFAPILGLRVLLTSRWSSMLKLPWVLEDCEHALALNGSHVKAKPKLWTRTSPWVFLHAVSQELKAGQTKYLKRNPWLLMPATMQLVFELLGSASSNSRQSLILSALDFRQMPVRALLAFVFSAGASSKGKGTLRAAALC